MKKLTRTTVLAGVAGLASVVMIGSTAFANGSSSSSASSVPSDPVACSAALTANATVTVPAQDALYAAQKTAAANRVAALKAALLLTDLTQRRTAIKNAEKTYMDALRAAATQYQTATAAANASLKTACRGLLGGKSRMEMNAFMKFKGEKMEDNDRDFGMKSNGRGRR